MAVDIEARLHGPKSIIHAHPCRANRTTIVRRCVSTPRPEFPAAIVSDVASKASQASAAYTTKEAVQSTYANSLSSQSGVNLDEEVARMSALQNKYTAVSALIQAINDMFSELLSAVKST